MKRQVDFKALMKKTLSSSCFLFKKYKFFIVTLGIIIFNILLMQVGHSRIDMTQEKKYTLSKKTIEILSQIEDKIYFKIYFTGNLFTPELNSLKKEIKQLLSEFKYYSKFIDYEFINLYSMENEKKRPNRTRPMALVQCCGTRLVINNEEKKKHLVRSNVIRV